MSFCFGAITFLIGCDVKLLLSFEILNMLTFTTVVALQVNNHQKNPIFHQKKLDKVQAKTIGLRTKIYLDIRVAMR